MQTVLVLLLISAATLYLGRELYIRFFRKESKCDGCGFRPKPEQNR